ncbi:DNA polymerase III subunit epsilon [Candidatus Terasakiella magnetica]|uniref:DNA polymerase III subunit epsilon n=1 Tax=Candidatus Terasakiella magnetica TaxID=1867952 RepID=A0A1C3RGF5_9PROT|nr:DNA polymerase III subunit epsilon [Candidatus Terasakiella magnetica]SCA56339.1 DNA polymerase III subunit epsilon [Candidatus Terasakiella magnetica]
MREIVLDTETTGFEYKQGHRLVEIGCVELVNHMPTGNTYHQYINPERDMPEGAFRVHGLSEEFLRDFPLFKEVAQEFLDFIGDSTLIIHNAGFDEPFLNWELKQHQFPHMDNHIIDTLVMARKKFPGSPANLDALCRRYQVDNSNREKHGALLDSELLAEVYLELIGGRQPGLVLEKEAKASDEIASKERAFREPRPHVASEEELAAHAAFLEKIKDPLWLATEDN